MIFVRLCALAGAAFLVWRAAVSFNRDNTAHALAAALPARLAQWSGELAAAAGETCPAGWPPLKWAFLLAALVDRESRGGEALSPRGPAGTGDQGHGRGLVQLDDRGPSGSRSALEHELWDTIRSPLLRSGGWQDPRANIRAGARILARLVEEAPSIRHALAAYNAGSDRVFDSDNPDSRTSGRNYSADVLSRADAFDRAEVNS